MVGERTFLGNVVARPASPRNVYSRMEVEMITAKFKGFSIACPHPDCLKELTVLDDIDGDLDETLIEFCPICGERLQ